LANDFICYQGMGSMKAMCDICDVGRYNHDYSDDAMRLRHMVASVEWMIWHLLYTSIEDIW